MLQLLWIIPALPLAGFLALCLSGGRLSQRSAAFVGVGSIGSAALLAVILSASFLSAPPPEYSYDQILWTWMDVGGFTPRVAFHLDALSLVMVLVVTFVGFLIHFYSTGFMAGDEGFTRFFAYMNLFVASMLVLILADNLVLLYLGWEGVGLCSYLLIGFWYQNPGNGAAAQKAFIVTRVGDTGMGIGLFFLFRQLGTLDIQALLPRIVAQWPVGSSGATLASGLLLVGALGKSAQLPLQTWLPDAMAGPTPVSALIHAATMVTAGVYLIARMHTLFTHAPAVLTSVAVIGAVTLLVAGASALVQRDIKRILAYSTISQIGYMFLALGVGAWSAAMFHFVTHAFFKALLFLAAGAVTASLHHEHDIFRMGGLRRRLPVTFWTFLVGAASLAGFPFVTSGFYSKDLILFRALSSETGGYLLWGAGIVGAFLTAVYIFRLIFLVFFGNERSHAQSEAGRPMLIPLMVLAGLSIGAGFLEVPHLLGGRPVFSAFMETALPGAAGAEQAGTELFSQSVAIVAGLGGICLAYVLFVKRTAHADEPGPGAGVLTRFLFAGWGFDWLYDKVFVRPVVWFARVNRNDIIDRPYQGIAAFSRLFYGLLSLTETGRVRWYAAGIAFGSVVVLTILVFY